MNHPYLPSGIVKLIAIDPGSFKCGFCVYDIDFKERKIVRISAETIKVESLKNDTGIPEELITASSLRYYKLRSELVKRFDELTPHYVAYEGPFMNRLQPSAFGPLVAMMTLVRDAVIHYNVGVPFTIFQPQVVKKSVDIAGKKGKEVVIEALRKVSEIMDALVTDLDTLDDNAIDAIAVGYAFFKDQIQKSNDQPSKKKG